jgi:hypothetical protein
MAVEYSPSQLSYHSDTSPINFRLSPLKLLWSDLGLIPQLLWTLPQTVLPLPTDNKRAELNFRVRGNDVSIVLQTIVGVISLISLVALPVVIFIPISVAGFGIYCGGIVALCAPGKPPVVRRVAHSSVVVS